MPFRVLQVVPSLSRNGGVAQMMWRVYRALDRHRLQFDFLTHDTPDNFQDEVCSLGARVFRIETLGRLGPFSYVATIRRIIREQGPFAAVHVHTNYQAGIVGIAARLEKVDKRICHIQGTYITPRNRAMLPMYLLLIRLGCNLRLACNEEAGRYYYGSHEFVVVPNAIDFNEFKYDGLKASAIRNELGLDSYEVVLGHVGRFTIEKNHRFSIDVLEEMRRTGANACLVLAGDGPLKRAIEKRVSAKGLAAHVKFLGVRPDVPALLAGLDVLLLPSLSEGQPSVVIEAQASGLPCLVSDGVTRSVDFGLGLLTFLPLDSPADWVPSLRARHTGQRRQEPRIHEAFCRAGFDVHQSAKNLTALYETIGGQ